MRNLWITLLALILALPQGGFSLQQPMDITNCAGPVTSQSYVAAVLPRALVVNETGDQNDADLADSACDYDKTKPGSQCTLRAAIQQANAIAYSQLINQPRLIQFNLPNSNLPIIAPHCPLPDINVPLVLDASTQVGGRVVVDGIAAGVSNGLRVGRGSLTVRELTITRFSLSGLQQSSPLPMTLANNAGVTLQNVRLLDNRAYGIQTSGSLVIIPANATGITPAIAAGDTGPGSEIAGNGKAGIIQTGTAASSLVIQSLNVHDNGGWGIQWNGPLAVNGSLKVNNNKEGGILNARGNITVASTAALQASGNGGTGLQTRLGNMLLENLQVNRNAGHGISVAGRLRIGLNSNKNEIRDNGGRGISQAGRGMELYNLIVSGNAAEGIWTPGDARLVNTVLCTNQQGIHAASVDLLQVEACLNRGVGIQLEPGLSATLVAPLPSRIYSSQVARNGRDGVFNIAATNFVIAESNIFENTGLGVNNTLLKMLEADGNWWGDASGPGGAGPGSGDEVSKYVNYTPWREKPAAVSLEPVQRISRVSITSATDSPSAAYTPRPTPVFYFPPKIPGVVTVFVQNWARRGDMLEVQASDNLGWLTTKAFVPLKLGDELGASFNLTFKIPEGFLLHECQAADEAFIIGLATVVDTVTVTAVSLSNPDERATLTFYVAPGLAADLRLEISAPPEPSTLGKPLQYVLQVHNQGESQAANVQVVDTLPEGVTLLAATSSQGSCSLANPVTCALGTLEPGGEATVTLLVQTGQGGLLLNQAQVSAGDSADLDDWDNSAWVSTLVEARVYLPFLQK